MNQETPQKAAEAATLTDSILAEITATSGPIKAFPMTASERHFTGKFFRFAGLFITALIIAIGLHFVGGRGDSSFGQSGMFEQGGFR